jgi:hypothetical protein
MKSPAILVMMLGLANLALAHDEGHGPKLTDAPRQGGVISPVIDAKEAKLGPKAKLIHKAELVRAEDGTVRVYLYDEAMKPLDLAGFDGKAQGILEYKKSKKDKSWSKEKFELELKDGAYLGSPKKVTSKPFNIDVTMKKSGKDLLVAFDDLG